MIAVYFFVKTMSEEDFLLNGGNKLYIYTALPDSFVQHNKLVRVEHKEIILTSIQVRSLLIKNL